MKHKKVRAPIKLTSHWRKRLWISLHNESASLNLTLPPKQDTMLQWYVSQKKDFNFNRWNTI